MIIAVDFDGTCVTHEFPYVGKEIGAAEVLKELTDKGHKIILFTMRSHPEEINQKGIAYSDALQDAIDWFKKYDIPLFGVNENPTQKGWTSSPKPYAHIYIDDAALGVPLKKDSLSERPYVDWGIVKYYLHVKNIL
ncbi:polynucleotide kinase/phosphatase [uncultured phage cr106_1]|uniref:Polynucleotide kinase/phosphatase n=1 Tax=uncultured phage cr106_1 TaxID=2772062 RepID=A0A7M1RWU3_9CAUD|nr:phosphoheptose isomerase [uncultured phage cr106_1]QOR58331.1 polynucleotide kinase/phosphatase [uncultured phage cr106_1]